MCVLRKHGVSVLGTIVFEWDEGARLLETLLSSDEKIDKFVKVAARLCAHYGFHGYLLNEESGVSRELIPKLLKLVGDLTTEVKKHVGNEGFILWYDAVTINVR